MFFDRRMVYRGIYRTLVLKKGLESTVERKGADSTVKWFDVDLGFIFHAVNAYETATGTWY